MSGCDTPPVFDPAEHDLDPVAPLVSPLVVFDRFVARLPSRGAGFNALFYQVVTEPVRIVFTISM